MLDLDLFKVRQFGLVNAASLLFAASFYGSLLANVIFLQTVWHYSVLWSALATTPSPVVVTLVARFSIRLAHTKGPRPVLTAGAILYAASVAGYAALVGTHPHWLAVWLPISLLMGVGIALTLPVQSSAAVQALPPGSFAVGSAINSSFRQLGAVLGISLFVAVLGTPGPATAPAAFHHVWWLLAALGLGAGPVLWLPRARGEGMQASTRGSAR